MKSLTINGKRTVSQQQEYLLQISKFGAHVDIMNISFSIYFFIKPMIKICTNTKNDFQE